MWGRLFCNWKKLWEMCRCNDVFNCIDYCGRGHCSSCSCRCGHLAVDAPFFPSRSTAEETAEGTGANPSPAVWLGENWHVRGSNSDLEAFIFSRFLNSKHLHLLEGWASNHYQANCLFFGWHVVPMHIVCCFDFQQREGQLWAVLAPKNGTRGAFWEVPYVEALQLSVGSFKSAFSLFSLECRFETWSVKLRTQILISY